MVETRIDMKGKGLLQVYVPIEDLIWIDQQKVKGFASSRAAVVHKLVAQAQVVE